LPLPFHRSDLNHVSNRLQGSASTADESAPASRHARKHLDRSIRLRTTRPRVRRTQRPRDVRRVQESAASAHRVRAMRPETIDKTVATEANRGVLAMAPPLSVSVCLSEVGVILKWLDGSSRFLARRIISTGPVACFKGKSAIYKNGGTSLRNIFVNWRKFRHAAHRSSTRVISSP